MSDVERLTAENQAKLRYAAEISRQRSEAKKVNRAIRADEAKRQRRKWWKRQAVFLLSFLCGVASAYVVYCLCFGIEGPSAVIALLLAFLAVLGGAALEEV